MEPYIKSILNVAQKIPVKQISGLTTGVVIHSKLGPIGPTKITSPRQFLDTYTTDRRVTKGDHPSMHNAFFLSRYTDLIVVRATDSSIIPLSGIKNSTTSTSFLTNGRYADTSQIITPTIPLSPGDARSMWLQVDNVLFYGKGGVNPFLDGDGKKGGTALTQVKGTQPKQLELMGLGQSTDYVTVELSDELVTMVNGKPEINMDVLPEVVREFRKGGRAYKSNLHVELNSAGLKISYSSDFPVDTDSFMPVNINDKGEKQTNSPIHNITSVSSPRSMSSNSEPFLIGTKNVGSVNSLKVWITDTKKEGEFQYWTLHLEDVVRGHVSYPCSDNPDSYNSMGDPIYYTYVSELRPEIIYVKNESSTQDVEDVPKGEYNVGKSDDYLSSYADFKNGKWITNREKLLGSAIYAASVFEGYTDTRIQLYTDAGWYNAGVGKMLESISRATKSLTCIGVEPTVVDKNYIKLYASKYNSFYSIVHCNGGKDTSVTGFQLPISPSCYYIETLARNNTRNNTYAPIFSKNNGAISEGRLFTSFSKQDRDELNEARVNVLVYDDTDGISYINNNLLSDSSGSLIDEDQSIRIVNDIEYDIAKLMERFYSRFNRDTTRALVESSIKNYFDTVVLSQNYTISGYRVECSEVNNTEATIQNNELRVDVYVKLNHSIKYITVTTNVVPTL